LVYVDLRFGASPQPLRVTIHATTDLDQSISQHPQTALRNCQASPLDAKNLLVAVKSEGPPDGRVLTRAVPHPQHDVIAAFHDDSLEYLDTARVENLVVSEDFNNP